MKHLLLIILLIPSLCQAQSKQDYMAAMNKYVKLYNSREADKMCAALFVPDQNGCFWKLVNPGKLYNEYGKIDKYEYLGVATEDPEHVTVFMVQYRKAGTRTMSFTLRENKKFSTFRFDTSSDEIKEMLRKHIKQ